MNNSTRMTRWAGFSAAATVGMAASGMAVGGGYAGPVITPETLEFGAVEVGSTSPVETLTVSSLGPGSVALPSGLQELEIISINIPPGFVRDGGDCPEFGTAPDPCTIDIAFAPTNLGEQTDSLTVEASVFGDPPGITSVQVSGEGVAGAPAPAIGVPVGSMTGLVLLAAVVVTLAVIKLRGR
jgi:hypothetical protein